MYKPVTVIIEKPSQADVGTKRLEDINQYITERVRSSFEWYAQDYLDIEVKDFKTIQFELIGTMNRIALSVDKVQSNYDGSIVPCGTLNSWISYDSNSAHLKCFENIMSFMKNKIGKTENSNNLIS